MSGQFLPYVPITKRKVGEANPQTSPERFSTGDLKKEIAALRRLNKRLGWHPLRAEAIDRLHAHIAARTAHQERQEGSGSERPAAEAQTAEDQKTHDQQAVTVHLAIAPDGGSNVFADGFPCRDCDDTYDPYHRTGVPCRNAAAHAANTVRNWGAGARLETVQVPAGEINDVIAHARTEAGVTADTELADTELPGNAGDAADPDEQLRRQGRCTYQTGIEWGREHYCGHPADPDLFATSLEGLCTRHGRQATGIEDPEINVGDRVRDSDPGADPDWLGTVTAVDNDGYRVRWDGQDTDHQAEYGELDPIDPTPPGPTHSTGGTGHGGTPPHGQPPDGETTGLGPALTYTTQMATNIAHAAAGTETSIANLTTGGVTGPAITALQAAQEAMTTAAAHFQTAHAALQRHVQVQEAYAANTDAGTRQFLTTD